MSLYEKIVAKHPELTADDFHPATGTILLVDDSDGFGPRIARWDHPTIPRPSDEELEITVNPIHRIIEGEIIPDVAVLEAPADEQVGGA